MKQINESTNTPKWPKQQIDRITCRKRDLIIRIANWMEDEDEPGYDVECYIGGVCDWNESKSLTIFEYKTKAMAKKQAINFAQKQIAKLL
jgi:hypothetical protein